jgi:type II secretion system protein N
MAAPTKSRLPRWLVIASYPVAALVLILFFIFLGFPYNQLAQRLGRIVESNTNIQIRIGDLSPQIGLGGPELAASEVLARIEDKQPIVIERMVLRPAWSLSWFRAQPAIYLDVTSDVGDVSGTLILGSDWGWDGTLKHVHFDLLPLEMIETFDLHGNLDATIDLQRTTTEAGSGFVGRVEFDLREGTLRTEGLPIALPFESLHGRLDFGGEKYIHLSGVELQGPLLDGTIQGDVGYATGSSGQPISIDVAFRLRNDGLASMLGAVAGQGEDGRSHIQITGTLARPVIR